MMVCLVVKNLVPLFITPIHVDVSGESPAGGAVVQITVPIGSTDASI